MGRRNASVDHGVVETLKEALRLAKGSIPEGQWREAYRWACQAAVPVAESLSWGAFYVACATPTAQRGLRLQMNKESARIAFNLAADHRLKGPEIKEAVEQYLNRLLKDSDKFVKTISANDVLGALQVYVDNKQKKSAGVYMVGIIETYAGKVPLWSDGVRGYDEQHPAPSS